MRRALLAIYFIAIAIFFGSYSTLRFFNMRFYGDAPTLIMAICQYPKIKGVLSVHFSYALLIFRPLCWFLPCWGVVAVLAFLQGVALAFAAYVIYKMALEAFKDWRIGFIASLAYALHPGNHGIVTFDIHPEAYALPFIALGTYFLAMKDEPLKGYLSFFVALMFKETVVFPLAGVALWRLATKRARKLETIIIVLTIISIPIGVFIAKKVLHIRLLIDRWLLFFKVPSARFNYIKIQYIAVTLLSVFPALLPSRNVLLWLPDFTNALLTTSWYHFKFWYGFQYPTFWIFELFTAAILNTRNFKRALWIWLAELALIVALAAVADPLAYYATLYTYFIYYLTNGEPSPVPLYPWMSLTTYRPIALNYFNCFESALKLYHVAEKFLKPTERVVVSDPLMAIFACKYHPKFTGYMAIKDWSIMTLFSPQRTLRFVAVRLASRVLVDLYGSVRTLDLPKYIWKPLVVNAVMVKDAGYVYIFNTTLLHEIKEVIKYHKTVDDPKVKEVLKEVRRPYGLRTKDGKGVPTLYVDLGRYGIKKRTWLYGKIYVDVNGKYEFYGSPAILKVIIDGKVLKPTKKVVVMQDFVHARYFGSLNLTEGWHDIKVEVNPGWAQLYWKTPYSCAPYPPSAARFRPN